MKLRTNKKRIVKPYLVEYMFGKINKVLAWFDDEEGMKYFIDDITSYNTLTHCKKYEVKEIKD